MEKAFIKQKSRIQWLKGKDQNTSYFFKCIKGRQNRIAINCIFHEDETITFDKKKVKKGLMGVFHNPLHGSRQSIDENSIEELINFKIPKIETIKKVTSKEIKKVMFPNWEYYANLCNHI